MHAFVSRKTLEGHLQLIFSQHIHHGLRAHRSMGLLRLILGRVPHRARRPQRRPFLIDNDFSSKLPPDIRNTPPPTAPSPKVRTRLRRPLHASICSSFHGQKACPTLLPCSKWCAGPLMADSLTWFGGVGLEPHLQQSSSEQSGSWSGVCAPLVEPQSQRKWYSATWRTGCSCLTSIGYVKLGGDLSCFIWRRQQTPADRDRGPQKKPRP